MLGSEEEDCKLVNNLKFKNTHKCFMGGKKANACLLEFKEYFGEQH